MHYDKKRSKILKIALPCLLVAIIGTVTYAIINHSSVDTSDSSSQSSVPASTNTSKLTKPASTNSQTTNDSNLQAQTNANQQGAATLKAQEAQAQQEQQQQAQQQCQTAKQELASSQESLSSAQETYSSDQQKLTSLEQSLSTEGVLANAETQQLILTYQQEVIPIDQTGINTATNWVNADQPLVDQSCK